MPPNTSEAEMVFARRLFLGSFAALLVAGSVVAAPVRSPSRQAAAASLAHKRASAGEQWPSF